MEMPPVEYIRTPDGFNIACAAGGKGSPVVFLPFHHNHLARRWTSIPWVPRLAEHHYVVHYDSRGQGLSTRGLTTDPNPADYRRDLESVIEATGLDTFSLVAYGGFAHVGLAYAVDNPDRVRGLILICTCESFEAWPLPAMLPLAEKNWDLFLQLEVQTLPLQVQAAVVESLKDCSTQSDFIRMVRAFEKSHVTDLLPRLQTPTLLLHSSSQHWLSPEEGAKFAAKVPGARLVFLDGQLEPDAVQGVRAMVAFLEELPAPARQVAAVATRQRPVLSARQAEVLRLLADGKTNREIADMLVLSERTVERHVAEVYLRLDVRNRTEAASYAHQKGIV